KNRARVHGGRCREPDSVSGERPFTEKVAKAQYAYDGFSAGLRQHRQFHAPVLNVEDGIGRVALRVDDGVRWIRDDLSGYARRGKEGLCIEPASVRRLHRDSLRLFYDPGTQAA